MEHSTLQVSNHLPLQQFVAGAVRELERLQYSRRSLERYRVVWQRLISFCHEMRSGDEYSQNLAAQFCTVYQVRAGECLASGQGWRRHIVFALKVLEDFARDGYIERTVTDMQKMQAPASMSRTLRDYELRWTRLNLTVVGFSCWRALARRA
ncbi:hypothetical protein [Burkholderia sp. TSV86]|uniref:hypothetical protein n=1 Tax=Burkholderia sp. TSV86 TaxID=1385594 RepID=UPI00075A6D6A|nr:hypothetical protein [Burkholderia sp. TSV86]KVE31725.1 hypothetical protein WS68_16705 [Burkholderia sp. TSV86]